MTEPRTLTADELARAIGDLPDWDIDGRRFRRELRFADFAAAFGFMAEIAVVAEAMGHHPEWSNVYDRVVIELRTHDVGGVSSRDVDLARRIDAIADRAG